MFDSDVNEHFQKLSFATLLKLLFIFSDYSTNVEGCFIILFVILEI